MHITLISPPIARACEPLLGIATLKAFLGQHGVSCDCIDANAEAQEWLLQVDRLDPMIERLERSPDAPEPLRRRAKSWRALRRRLDRMKRQLRSWEGYTNADRYRTTVTGLNRVVQLAGAAWDLEAGSPISATLSNYEDARTCDMDASSVAEAARDPSRNLFYLWFRDQLLPRLEATKPDIVGLSFIFRSQLLGGLALATMIRERLPETRVVLGGELVSAWVPVLEQTELIDLADAIIPYEGELALLELARALEANPKRPALSKVPNLIWRDRDTGEVHRNPTRKVQRLGEVPAPDYSDMPWDLYFAPVRTAPMVTARGCYWNRCTFCPEVVNPETLLRIAPADRIIEDIDALYERWGVTHVHFIDSALPPRTIKDLARQIAASDRPTTWYGFSRLERTFLRPGVADLLAAGGCRMLKLGLETGSQRLLDAMDKRQDLGDVSGILKALRDAGVMVHAFLMFGTPFEGREDALLTQRFVADHADCIQFVNCSLMNLAHGSPMALEPEAHGIREVLPFEIEGRTLDLALYSNFVGEGWSRVEARRFLHGSFLKDPRVRPLHLRTPALFDSNHSSFFHQVVFPGWSRPTRRRQGAATVSVSAP